MTAALGPLDREVSATEDPAARPADPALSLGEFRAALLARNNFGTYHLPVPPVEIQGVITIQEVTSEC